MTTSLNLPLARSAVDRDYLQRTNPNLFAELWLNSATRILPMYDGKVLLEQNDEVAEPALRLVSVDQVSTFSYRVYLGLTTVATEIAPASTPVVLAVLDEAAALDLASAEEWRNLRRTGAGLSDLDAGLYAQALAIANWHENHPRCTLCGNETRIIDAGWVRHCDLDDKDSYPRTDPAIIAAVVDDHDRILMGSQGIWEDNRWSVLAGFVEPGESLNAAVQRELFEEAGIRVDSIDFLGSQSWPFPYSLMLGFTARARGEQELKPDGLEIEKLRWFSRDEIAARASEMLLPGRLSIARALIENWYGSEIVSASDLRAAK